MRRHQSYRLVGAAAAVLLTSTLLTGCGGDDRSAQAFCSAFKTNAIALHAKYEGAANASQGGSGLGALSGLLTIAQAPGDMLVMFKDMDQHAPDSIEPSVSTIIDSLQREQDAMGSGSVLGMLAGGLSASLSSGGAWTNVDNYLKANCDLSFENTN